MLTEDDDSLKKFWEIEDYNTKQLVLSPEERTVLQHFESTYSRNNLGRFVVPLLRKLGVKLLEESRTQAEERFVRLERSLKKGSVSGIRQSSQRIFRVEACRASTRGGVGPAIQ